MHTNIVRANVSRGIGIICKLRSLIPVWLKKQLYYTLVHSHIHYCLLVWGTTTKTNMESILMLQKRVLRIIEGEPYHCHTAPIFKKQQILTIGNILNKKIATVIYNQRVSDPSGFVNKYLRREHCHDLRHAFYKKEKLRTNYGTQKLDYLIPDFLHKHPDALSIIERSTSVHALKKSMHTYLLSFQWGRAG